MSLPKLLTILDSRLRGNDMFFQLVSSLSVIPAKAGIRELIDNLSIIDKQVLFYEKQSQSQALLIKLFSKRSTHNTNKIRRELPFSRVAELALN